MTELAFLQDAFSSLRAELFVQSPNEAAAVLLAGYHDVNGHPRLTIREHFIVPPESYVAQSPVAVTIDPAFLALRLKEARNSGLAIVLVHSHPFSDERVQFSVIDDEAESLLMPSLFGRAPGRPHGSLVLGRRGFDARIRKDQSSAATSVEQIAEVGATLTRTPHRETNRSTFTEIHDRQLRALGREGQRTLAQLTVAIVGLGGIGSIVVEQLSHLGVGRLVLVDFDLLERTNLNRVAGSSTRDVGRPKVEVAADLVRRISENVLVAPHLGDVRAAKFARIAMEADVIFCCTDSHGSRAVLNQLAYQYFRPVIDIGVSIDARGGRVGSVAGRVQMLSPGMPCLVCHNLLDPEEVRRDLLSEEERRRDPYITGVHEPQPAVMSLNGTVASLGVTMFLAATTGFPSVARHQIYLGQLGTVRAIDSTQAEKCFVCSRVGALGKGDSWSMPWRLG